MKLSDNIQKQIEAWYDIEWNTLSLDEAKSLAQSVFKTFESIGGQDCILLMMIINPSKLDEDWDSVATGPFWREMT